MSHRIECPECGGPLVDAGGDDLRCVECGFTRQEFSEDFDDDDLDDDEDDDFDDDDFDDQ